MSKRIPTSKTTIESRTTDRIVDGRTGEILQENESLTTKTIIRQEPAFIKLYLDRVMYISDMPKSCSKLTYELLKRCTYAGDDDGLCVILTPYVKEKIAAVCGWKKVQSLNNELAKLVKGDILKILGTGVYQFNPEIFGKGDWRDIESIRSEWCWDCHGETFSTVISYREEEGGQMAFDVENVNNGEEGKADTDIRKSDGEAHILLPDTGSADRQSA